VCDSVVSVHICSNRLYTVYVSPSMYYLIDGLPYMVVELICLCIPAVYPYALSMCVLLLKWDFCTYILTASTFEAFWLLELCAQLIHFPAHLRWWLCWLDLLNEGLYGHHCVMRFQEAPTSSSWVILKIEPRWLMTGLKTAFLGLKEDICPQTLGW
jgi:hypothetical protein